jgi:hypothetical protein
MSPPNPSAPLSTIPGVTGPGTEVAEVTITLDRTNPITKTLDPPPQQPVAISFIHQDPGHPGPPTHARPHGIMWKVVGLQQNERIEIQLDCSFPGYEQPPTSYQPWWEHLKRLFPYAGPLAQSGAWGFELTMNTPTAMSGRAVLPQYFKLKKHPTKNRPLLSYNVVFFDANGVPTVIDPDIDVEPDP